MRGRGREIIRPIAALAVLVAAGLAAKAWRGPLAPWANDFLAGVIYVIFWIVLAKTVWPRAASRRIALIVLAVTCVLETMQLWKPPLLEAIRGTGIGRALIGTTFSWLDFPHYVAGALVGAALAGWVVCERGE
jgi:hypothetical protein